jgi:hypothetical protein
VQPVFGELELEPDPTTRRREDRAGELLHLNDDGRRSA